MDFDTVAWRSEEILFWIDSHLEKEQHHEQQ